MRHRLSGILPFAPVIGGVFTYLVYRAFFSEAGINGIGRHFSNIALERRTPDAIAGLGPIEGLLAWGVTGSFFVLAFLGGVTVLLHIFNEALQTRSKTARYIAIAVCLGAVAAVGLTNYAGNAFAVNSLNDLLVESLRLHGIEGAITLLNLFTPMVLAVTVLLMASAWATLSIDTEGESDAGLTIKNQLRSINRMLFVGAVVLVAGVVHSGAVHRLPAVLMNSFHSETWNELISALSASSGAIWTLLLLGIYLPSIVVLRLRVRALAMASVTQQTPEHVDKWLSTHGLTVQFPALIAQLGAIVSPFLVGGPASPLIGLFGG